jgi:hypothetical protein
MKIKASKRVVRMLWAAAALSTFVRAQEEVAVGFDLKSDGPEATGAAFAECAIIALGCYVYWRGAAWLLKRLRGRTDWKTLRIWWPSLMLAAAGVAFLTGDPHGLPCEIVFGTMVAIVVFLNIPVIPAIPVIAFFTSNSPLPGWGRAAVAGICFWAAWYGIIRLVEWRQHVTERVSLGIR